MRQVELFVPVGRIDLDRAQRAVMAAGWSVRALWAGWSVAAGRAVADYSRSTRSAAVRVGAVFAALPMVATAAWYSAGPSSTGLEFDD